MEPMPRRSSEVVICGAGIAGVSAAYHLAVRCGVRGVVLVDCGPPLSLTSDKSTEAYRNWWPGPDDAMVRLMNRSIDLLEELATACDNRFRLSRRGYVWATADPGRADAYRSSGELAMAQGAGELRIHTGRNSDPDYRPWAADGWRDQPDGADLIYDDHLRRQLFPSLAGDVYAILHTRRCGWMSGQQYGMEMLERARAAGVELIDGEVEAFDTVGGRVTGVVVAERGGRRTLPTGRVVSRRVPTPAGRGSARPRAAGVLRAPPQDVVRRHPGVVPRDAPLLIWEDPQHLAWTDEERDGLAARTTPAG